LSPRANPPQTPSCISCETRLYALTLRGRRPVRFCGFPFPFARQVPLEGPTRSTSSFWTSFFSFDVFLFLSPSVPNRCPLLFLMAPESGPPMGALSFSPPIRQTFPFKLSLSFPVRSGVAPALTTSFARLGDFFRSLSLECPPLLSPHFGGAAGCFTPSVMRAFSGSHYPPPSCVALAVLTSSALRPPNPVFAPHPRVCVPFRACSRGLVNCLSLPPPCFFDVVVCVTIPPKSFVLAFMLA